MQSVVKQDHLLATQAVIVVLLTYTSVRGRGHASSRAMALIRWLSLQTLLTSFDFRSVVAAQEDVASMFCGDAAHWCVHVQRWLRELDDMPQEGQGLIFAAGLTNLHRICPPCRVFQFLLSELVSGFAKALDTLLESSHFEVDEQDLRPDAKKARLQKPEAWKDWVSSAAAQQGRTKRGHAVVRLQGGAHESSVATWEAKEMTAYQRAAHRTATAGISGLSISSDAARLGDPAEEMLCLHAWSMHHNLGFSLPPQV